MKRLKNYLVAPVAAAGLLVLTACPDRDRATAPPPTADREAEPWAGREDGAAPYGEGQADRALAGEDRNFVMQSARGHMAEKELGQLAEERATRSEVKDFARQLRQDHEQANEQLTRIADQTQVTLPQEMDQQHRQTMDRMRGVRGAQFDRQFLQHVVQEHQQKIQQYQQMQQQAQHPEVRNYASNQLPKLQEHLRKAQELQGQAGAGADREAGGHQQTPRY
jgi:putative membrane protein